MVRRGGGREGERNVGGRGGGGREGRRGEGGQEGRGEQEGGRWRSKLKALCTCSMFNNMTVSYSSSVNIT